jgi:hypothetical protein
MSKPKKGNKNQHHKGYTFNEALLQYNVKNYTGTLMRLKTATLKPHETERAENLKQATLLRLAYTDFSNYQYEQALQRLQLLPANNAIAHALTGVIYLYQNEFTKAAAVFKNLIQNPDYQGFTAYYLLAELYIGQPEKYDDFKNWHEKTFAQCTPFQQDYIHIAFYIIHGQFDHALNLVNRTKGASHTQHGHIEALKQVLSLGKTEHVGALAPTTKALYRLLLGHPLQDFETAYFSEKQAESPLFTGILKQQTSLTPDLFPELKALCETDKILTEGVLARVMKAVPEGYRPYIAYNQAVNALEHDDFDVCDRGVKHIIVTYPQYLVQIPESLTLYLHFHLIDDIRVYPNTFWQFFNQWLSIHKTRVSTENLDALGWSLFNIILANAPLIQGSYSRSLINLYEAQPSMFSIKFTYIYFTSFSMATNIPFDKGALDLFALPNAEKNKEKFAERLDEMLVALIATTKMSGRSIFNFDEPAIPVSFIKNQIEHFTKALIQAVTTHEIPPKNTIALEAFKILNKHFQELYSNTSSSSRAEVAFIDTFSKTYKQLLEKFPITKTKEDYIKDIKSLNTSAYRKPFLNLVTKGASQLEFNAFFNKHPNIEDYGFTWDILCSALSNEHFNIDELDTLVEFIKALYVKLGNSQQLIQEAKNFVDAYKKMSKGFDCEHPTEFYAQFMSALFLQIKLPPMLIYTFFKEYLLVFTTDHKFESKNYNAVGDFLEWLFRRQKDIVYDKDLVQQAIAYLEEVNKIKGLKKLETTLKKARVLAT